MMKEEGNSGGGGARSGGWARTCDSCRSAACSVYCRADSAYLCAGCDARCHAANPVASRHERVWVCEACERAPAAFTCKADAAALCTTCDTDIHSANPLARRHHRVPILPISGFLFGPSPAHMGKPLSPEIDLEDGFMSHEGGEEVVHEEEEDETSSWLLLNPLKNDNQSNNGMVFGGEVDGYLDLVEYNSCTESQYQDPYYQHPDPHRGAEVSDRVVPVQYIEQKQQEPSRPDLQLNINYEAPKAGFGYNCSVSHSVSYSSIDASLVPDASLNDISNTHNRPPKGTIDLFSSPPLQVPPHLSLDREARVLRYREKRKMRKFEKTIRYASRKAYAETRPRIKGRFAKRIDVEVEVDHLFASSVIAESGYGIVPSF